MKTHKIHTKADKTTNMQPLMLWMCASLHLLYHFLLEAQLTPYLLNVKRLVNDELFGCANVWWEIRAKNELVCCAVIVARLLWHCVAAAASQHQSVTDTVPLAVSTHIQSTQLNYNYILPPHESHKTGNYSCRWHRQMLTDFHDSFTNGHSSNLQ